MKGAPCKMRQLKAHLRVAVQIIFAIIFVLLLSRDLPGDSTRSALRPVSLRCEYLSNPLGVDVTRPRLSWVLALRNPNERGAKQSAYQILVSSSATKLQSGRADLWDSGKVDSDQSIQVPYAGRPLASRTSCWWEVRVWDQKGEVSAWSEPGLWSMGLLAPSDWQGHWISGATDKQETYAVLLRRTFTGWDITSSI